MRIKMYQKDYLENKENLTFWGAENQLRLKNTDKKFTITLFYENKYQKTLVREFLIFSDKSSNL